MPHDKGHGRRSFLSTAMAGDADGGLNADSRPYAKKFSRPYAHRLVTGGVGRNLPQEASSVVRAVIDVDRW